MYIDQCYHTSKVWLSHSHQAKYETHVVTIVHYCGRSAPCGLSWLRLTPCMVNKRGRRTSDSGTLSFPQNSLSAMPEVFRKIKLCNRRFCLNRRFPTSFPGSQSNNELQTPESKVWEGISDGLCAIGDWCQYQTNATRNVFFLFSGHVLWQILRSYMSSPLWARHAENIPLTRRCIVLLSKPRWR